MKKIASFTVNHLDLLGGIYTSRIDYVGDHPITTYDLRMKEPNKEPVMNTAEMHTIEHLAATFLRNHPTYQEEVIYFGPMGCRTGFYLILKGDRTPLEITPLMIELFEFVAHFQEEVPGSSARDCGNFYDMNLPMARFEAQRYLDTVLHQISEARTTYPN